MGTIASTPTVTGGDSDCFWHSEQCKKAENIFQIFD